VVAIVAAQEYQWVFGATNRSVIPGVASFDFAKTERRVGTYYFYICDPRFRSGVHQDLHLIPVPGQEWINGHEWAKRQADQDSLGYKSLANGFAACDDPARLQAICDRFGPAHVQGFFDRWISQVPTPPDRYPTGMGRKNLPHRLGLRSGMPIVMGGGAVGTVQGAGLYCEGPAHR
jgi:hypothetical protein